MTDISTRSLEIFRELVDIYVETGEPVGSRTLSKRLDSTLSPATVRNIMSDLEAAGLLYAPHISAGRLPTEAGLRFFIHSVLEIGGLSDQERSQIEERCRATQCDTGTILEEASRILSSLSKCASLIVSPKRDSSLKHFECVFLSPGRALAILVSQDGHVENRLLHIASDWTAEHLTQASCLLRERLFGKTLDAIRHSLKGEIAAQQAHLDTLVENLIEAFPPSTQTMIVKGQSQLLEHVHELRDVENLKTLFAEFDAKETAERLLDASIQGEGVQIFIGSDNRLFQASGCSVVVSPYHNAERRIVGVIGVVGPTRMDYSKIIPLVDYTAKIVGRLLEERSTDSS